MKNICFAAVLALGSLTTLGVLAQAPVADDAPQQPHHHRMHNPHKQAEHLGRKLGLSSDQTSRLEPILVQRREQAKAIRQNTSLTPDQRREQMRDLHRKTTQQIAGLLTPDQMQQWKSMRKEHHRQREGTAPIGA